MEKGRTIVVGGGGFGREVIGWALDCHAAGLLPAIGGVIDDSRDVMDGFSYDIGPVGTIADFVPRPGDQLLMAIGSPRIKEAVAAQLTGRGGQFARLIHPTAVVARSATIGEGAIMCPLSLVSADARLGRLVSVNTMTSVGHDVRVGDYCTLSSHVDLTGGVDVGDNAMIGSGARVLPRVRIGVGATVGAGSVVYRSVAPGNSVFAAPAKLLAKT